MRRDHPGAGSLALLVVMALALAGAATGLSAETPGKDEGTPNSEPIRFADSQDSHVIAAETTGPSIYHRLWIEATGDQPVEGVRLQVTPLRRAEYDDTADGDETPVQVTVNGQPWTASRDVGLDDPLLVELRAELPRTGTYRGFAILKYEGGRQIRAVELARTSATPSIEAHGLAPAAGDARLWLALREKGLTDGEVGRPQVLELKRTVGGDGYAQGWFQWLDVRIAEGKSAERDCDEATAWTVQDGNGYRTVPRSESIRLLLEFVGLSTPGSYEGTLLVPVRNADPLRPSFKLTVRRPAEVAFLLILFGVLVSVALEFLTKTLRPRLHNLRRVEVCRRDLQRIKEGRTLDDRETSVAGFIEGELDDLADRVEIDAVTALDETLEVEDARLPLFATWLQARRFVRDLEPEIRASFAGVLADAEHRLLAKTPKVAELTSAESELRGLDAKVRTARKKQLLDRISETEKQAQELIATATAQKSELLLAEIRDEVATPLVEARDRLAAVPPDAADLEHARGKWQAARGELARILARRLRADLPAAPPKEFSALPQPDIEYGRLVERVAEHVEQAVAVGADADQAVAAYTAALRAYYSGLASALAEWESKIRKDVSSSHDGEQTAWKHELDEALVGLERLRRALAEQGFGDIGKSYLAVKKAIASVANAIKKEPLCEVMKQVQDEAAAVAGAAISGPLAALGEIRPSGPRRGEPVNSLTATIHSIDWFVVAITAFVSVALGLKVLWADNPTWGGVDDVLIALLWGLGLHQVGSTAAGYVGVSKKLKGES